MTTIFSSEAENLSWENTSLGSINSESEPFCHASEGMQLESEPSERRLARIFLTDFEKNLDQIPYTFLIFCRTLYCAMKKDRKKTIEILVKRVYFS